MLAGTKLIAEAWDAAGLYQVGNFMGDHWKEWNGHFRDDVRAFMKGDRKMISPVISRFLASPDLYGHENREPEQSINFVTCHDGFTLNDLVSYNEKHNEANNEANRDGHNYNLSWNCGVEGPTDDPAIERLRNRQIKNFFAINLLALGAPMILMGDEVRRTQWGNNNAYCQDNEIGWFDWSLLDKHPDIYRFVKRLIGFRLNLDIFVYDHGLCLTELLERAQIRWHGTKLDQPDWGDDSHSIAFTVRGRLETAHIILNAYWEPLTFKLPPAPKGGWRRIIDTSLDAPDDFCDLAVAPVMKRSVYTVQPHSVLLLAAELRRGRRQQT